MFFLSAVRVVIGPGNDQFAFLSVFEQNFDVSWWHACVFPLSPLGLVVFRLAVPLLAIAQLSLTFLAARAACCLPRCCPAASQHRLFTRTAFLRTLLALAMTSFTTVTTIVFETLSCVAAGQHSVVFALPAREFSSSARSVDRFFALLGCLLPPLTHP